APTNWPALTPGQWTSLSTLCRKARARGAWLSPATTPSIIPTTRAAILDTLTRPHASWRNGPLLAAQASRPYGIAIPQSGMVWYSESGVSPNTLVEFDPKSKTFASMSIPSGGGVVRNMVATPAGKLYLACSGVNKVAIAEPHRALGLY